MSLKIDFKNEETGLIRPKFKTSSHGNRNDLSEIDEGTDTLTTGPDNPKDGRPSHVILINFKVTFLLGIDIFMNYWVHLIGHYGGHSRILYNIINHIPSPLEQIHFIRISGIYHWYIGHGNWCLTHNKMHLGR